MPVAHQQLDSLAQAADSFQHDDLRRLRSLSLKQRGELIVAACRAAALIRESRLRSGMPDMVPAPWPESTWEFLRKHSPHGKQ